MPTPFPAQGGSLRVILHDEGWKRVNEFTSALSPTVVTWWSRGKHTILLVEQLGGPDTLWTPVGDPKRLVSVMVNRKGHIRSSRAHVAVEQLRAEHQGSRKINLLKLEK